MQNLNPRMDGKLSYTEKDGELAGGYDTSEAQKEEWRADIHNDLETVWRWQKKTFEEC